MITIIDYGMGNLKSIENAFRYLGVKVKITDKAKEIVGAKKLVFPGVGNFGQAIKNLRKKKLATAIKATLQRNVPFLGICLGLQLLFEKSAEAPQETGLSIFQGRVFKFEKIKVPQIGWNQVGILKRGELLKGVPNKSLCYFVHSFYVKPLDGKIVAAKTDYGIDFCSAIETKNIFGVQFHPEKSGKIGLGILKNFAELKC